MCVPTIPVPLLPIFCSKKTWRKVHEKLLWATVGWNDPDSAKCRGAGSSDKADTEWVLHFWTGNIKINGFGPFRGCSACGFGMIFTPGGPPDTTIGCGVSVKVALYG